MPTWRKKIIFNSMQAADILQLPGHTMIYLGKTATHYYTIDAVSHICNKDNVMLMIRSVAINTFDTKRNNVNPPAFFGEPPREFAPPLEKVNPLWSYLHPPKTENEPPQKPFANSVCLRFVAAIDIILEEILDGGTA